MIYTPNERYTSAVDLACSWFVGRKRKGTNVSYISHLLNVSSLVMHYGGDENQCIAALLHDCIEDIGTGCGNIINEIFDEDVLNLVKDCSDNRNIKGWRNRKEAYLNSFDQKSDRSLLIIYCDKIHNLSCILEDVLFHGETAFDKFKGKKEGVIWYYGSLLQHLKSMKFRIDRRVALRFEVLVNSLLDAYS